MQARGAVSGGGGGSVAMGLRCVKDAGKRCGAQGRTRGGTNAMGLACPPDGDFGSGLLPEGQCCVPGCIHGFVVARQTAQGTWVTGGVQQMSGGRRGSCLPSLNRHTAREPRETPQAHLALAYLVIVQGSD